MKYTIEDLEKIAKEDQSKDYSRPWTYTEKCYICGGVKNFIDWLKEYENSRN